MRLFIKVKELLILFLKGGAAYANYKGVKVGSNCRIYSHRFGSEPWLIEIGNNVTVTSNVTLLTHDGGNWLIRDEKGRRYLYKKVIIKDNVFIGVNSIIMPGVIIESNVIVAAGSVVTKSIPSGVIVGGNPAKIIGSYEQYKNRVLKNNISDLDLDLSKSYRDRINEVVNSEIKDYLK
ncbi:acyltransferase [Tenacibaculum halocynthiae]|uniref:acyltransferase n=1 Tax=Tenacibaculum halocynthiae TaxID=1254437 RepID=UPI003893AB51